MLKDPSKGVVAGNITVNPLFLDHVFKLAQANVTKGIIEELKRNQYNTVLLFDQRAPDIDRPIRELMDDLIGVYKLENGTVYFQPNPNYGYFSQHGLMRLTPQLRKQIAKN